MAGPTTETKATLSFKKLVGKAHTSNNTPFYSESIPSQISIDSGEILGESVPEDPQTAVNDGIAEYVELDLQAIAASNGLAYNIRFPSDYSGDFGTGVQGDLVRTHTQIVDQKNNRQDGFAVPGHTGGYVYDLEDGTGTQIPEGASENWQLDPVGGIIVSEQTITELQNNGGTVGAYVYTGDTLDESLGAIQGGNLAVEDSGSNTVTDVKTIDFGNALDVSGSGPVTVDVNDDLSNFDFSSVTTNDLSEPSSPTSSDNLYFTDERAQDAVGTILGSGFSYDDATPEITLANDSVTVAGNTVSLGGSTTVAVGDLSDVGSTTQTDGNALVSNGSEFVSEPLSTAAENHVALTDLSNVGTDADSRPQLPDLPSISGSTSPSKDSDVATKLYVDGVAQGLEIKDSVDAASTGNVDLGSPTDPNPIDGYTLSDGEFILLKDQTTATENGIYVANTAADPTTWTRREDFDDNGDVVSGAITFVENGTENADVSYIVTSDDPITVNTDNINFTVFSRAGTIQGGDGITKSGQTLDVNVSEFAGTNLTTETGGDSNDNLAITDETIQDSVYNNVLSGTQSRITVTYDDTNGEVDYVVDDDLSNYSFSSVTTDDVSEGSNNLYYTDARVKNDFQAGGDINYDKNKFSGQFDLSTASFSGTSFDVSSEENDLTGVTFNGDGTKMFVVGDSGDSVYEYDLTTGFDLSTASYSGTSFDVSNEDNQPTGVTFNGDGTKMFVVGRAFDNVFEYDLSTGFDLSTASYSGTSFDVSSEDTDPHGVQFNGDGSKMFMVGRSNLNVYEYDLTTGFDLSTASYSGTSFDVGSEDLNPYGFAFNDNGTKMFVVGNSNDNVFEYDLTTGFDLSTASYSGTSFDVSSEDGSPQGVQFNGDGTKMFVVGSQNDNVYEYDLGTPSGPAEFSLDVSALSPTDLFGSKTTDDLPEGSSNLYFTDERAQDAVGTILTGSGGAIVNYDDGADTITIDTSGAGTNVSNGGTQVVSGATDINFAENLTATADGDGTVTVSNDVNLATATFSGDGIQKEFQIAHGLSSTPDAWTVHATSDAASGISHSTADSTNITIVYDTAPPSGTDNITVNYLYERQ
jgi:hypothetical protein